MPVEPAEGREGGIVQARPHPKSNNEPSSDVGEEVRRGSEPYLADADAPGTERKDIPAAVALNG
jgi:hypothetical protein